MCLSVRLSAWNNWVSTRRIFTKLGIWILLANMSRKFKFHCYMTRIATFTAHCDSCKFMIISRRIILSMRNVSDKRRGEIRNTYFMANNTFFFWKACCLWYNAIKCGTARREANSNTTWRMRFACWITKATNTHSEYLIFMIFPRQQWLPKRATILHYTAPSVLLTHWGREGSFTLFKHPFPGFSIILTL